jgi:HSP20 family protein
MKPATAVAPIQPARKVAALDPFRFFQNRWNRLFDTFPPFLEEEMPLTTLTTWMPACDVYETDKELIIKAELPGVKKENVFVGLEANTLTIHGERIFEETKNETYHRVERTYGEFMRTFTLPAFIEPTQIVAEFKEGLLTVTLPKREEAKPKQIEVKVK